ncbi:spore coat protein CotH [Pseudoflavonifractor sp. 524-17]|uniref:CotH kinase family protein n=1 Tax=Pseudoflavonifractor sp. 524-17 TaxID=2304577 RepID=UPI00137ACE81|nr:CotH kinase family protein [Pseudoflavonifractor sp. 524-17]NCE66129.1 spore coat protein CotH [Pseudoflavonifractor sp. 524-17]
MSTNRHIERICLTITAAAVLFAFIFVEGSVVGAIQAAVRKMGYEKRLFNTNQVHTISIVMDGWEEFILSCEDEAYHPCTVVIDNEAYKNVGIRAKGNTSLSMVSTLGSQRYSFKLEFDHYDSTKSYHGLDKLCLNNIIQDNTYMKDFLVYQMMGAFGVDAPLCSYVYITVNGEDWGLYLAVEGIEEGFLQRSYGKSYGALYKPDSTDGQGGRNNKQGFGDRPMEGRGAQDSAALEGRFDAWESQRPGTPPGDGPGGGMGSSDVKLQYIDDDPDSYPNLFDSAKTDITQADQARLIQSLKQLSSGENLEQVLDMDEVLRYFVVHNFVCNGDSYTGSIVHNYYLYEEEGQLSMIPWDYNLAFGTFQNQGAASAVNEPIDTPVSGGSVEERPMLGWIFSDESYTDKYHQYFKDMLQQLVDSGWLETLIDSTQAQIAPYVEKDPTKFCTYEEFEAGTAALKSFCRLRGESVRGQLDGSIPATAEGQQADSAALVDASGLDLADMGTMEGGRPGNGAPDAFPTGSAQSGLEGADPPGGGARGDRVPPDDAPGNGMPERAGSGGYPPDIQEEARLDGRSQLLLLVLSAAVLSAGLIFAVKWRP